MPVVCMSRHRRKILLSTAAVIGGYLSYRLYKSPAVTRRRKALLRMLKSLYSLGNTATGAVEAASSVSQDLKAFLASEDDEVPNSLRQAFKIGQCQESKESLIIFFTALTQGVLQGSRTSLNKEEVKNVRLIQNRHEFGGWIPLKQTRLYQSANFQQRTIFSEQAAVSDSSSWSDMQGEYEWGIEPSLNGQLGQMQDKGKTEQEGRDVVVFSERFLDKLFSHTGTGFASAVVGSVARNLVLAVLGNSGQGNTGVYKNGSFAPSQSGKFGEVHSQERSLENKEMRIEQGSKAMQEDSYAEPFENQTPVLDFLCTDRCRSLIAECIQNFVNSAVSVYIEKTKDINYYDSMVAGITNPAHQAPMKDLLISVCNGAMETLIQTSHRVIFSKDTEEAEQISSQQGHGMQTTNMENISREPFNISDKMSLSRNETQATVQNGINEMLPFCCQSRNETQSTLQNGEHEMFPLSHSKSNEGDATLVEEINFKDKYRLSAGKLFPKHADENEQLHSWIEGISKILAIPSNRMLVMEVAGKMTSEAVHSTFEMMTSKISKLFTRRIPREQGVNHARLGRHIQSGKGQLQKIFSSFFKDLDIKFVVIATTFLIFCLHALLHFYFAGHA